LQEVKEATPGEIAKKAKIVRPTVHQALNRLLRLKKVDRIGMGRSTRYRKL
jgi:DNA-binding transcriptional ArsR family regulator